MRELRGGKITEGKEGGGDGKRADGRESHLYHTLSMLSSLSMRIIRTRRASSVPCRTDTFWGTMGGDSRSTARFCFK
jgi:hypothetical protein